MRLLFILVLACSAVIVNAQTTKEEINKQVWTPFIQAYNSFDTDKFMSVYSKDVVRIPADQKLILNYTEYRKSVMRENQFNKNYKIKASLEIRFTNRIHGVGRCHEHQGFSRTYPRDG